MFDKSSGLSIYNKIKRNSRLAIELALCSQRDDLQGIYLSPSFTNPQTWFGLIYVRYGIYSRASYRFIIIMGNDQYDPSIMKFPKNNTNTQHDTSSYWKLPRIYFYGPTKPYHPHIHPITGELNLSWYFKQWDETRHHIWHCLKCLKHIFYSKLAKSDLSPPPEEENSATKPPLKSTASNSSSISSSTPTSDNSIASPYQQASKPSSSSSRTLFNETAANTYQTNIQEYTQAVQFNIERTRNELDTIPTVTDDRFEPNYSKLDSDNIYLVAKNKMKIAGEKQKLTGWQAQNAQTSGHSFVMPGTIRPFSKR